MAANVVPDDEADLIQRSQRGDREAFAGLVDRYWNRLYRWLYHLSHNQHEAEDMAQEAFLKAFRSIAGFVPKVGFQAWLFRIAYNAFASLHRPKKLVRQTLPEEWLSKEQDPADAMLAAEAMIQLTRGVGRLPSEYRGPFLLRVEEEMSFQQIAEILDLTEETARWRVYKARQKLMEVMQPYLQTEDKP